MNRFLALISCLTIFFAGVAHASSEQFSDADKTLSPYFFIEDRDDGVENFPLKNTDVDVVISGVIANVRVKQCYANMGSVPISGRYIFPGSTRAAVHGMTMTIGERVIRAKIKEKKEAKKIYETAKKAGKSASLLVQQRPNVFSMDVANIMPGDTVDIDLRFTELLIPEEGTYAFVYPAVVGPRYSTLTAGTSLLGEQWAKNPYLKKGSESRTAFNISVSLAAGMALQEVKCLTHETKVDFQDDSRALITLPNPADFSGNRDYILRYRLAGRRIASGLLLQQGEKENFFLLMAQPPQRVKPEMIPPREYIFVVDVSGSMSGFPLDTAKGLLRDLIANLKPADSFNVLLFAGGTHVMAEKSVPAVPAEIRRAFNMIDNSRGGGGTELLKAMKRAMVLPYNEGTSRTLVVVTDGYINAEHEVFESIHKQLGSTNVFTFGIGSSVNRYLVEGLAKAGQGTPFVVTTPAEAGPAARKFRDYISSPVLTDIALSFQGLDTYDIEPLAIPDLFAERPVVVFGKFKGEPKGTIALAGKSGEGDFHTVFDVSEEPFDKSISGLDYLWARSRIGRISYFNPRHADPGNRDEIVSLGLRYNLLTAFTSFVAVDEIIRNPDGGSRDVKQPLPLPKGVSNLAIGGGMNQVPEPELAIMILLIFGLLLVGRLRKRKPASIPSRRK